MYGSGDVLLPNGRQINLLRLLDTDARVWTVKATYTDIDLVRSGCTCLTSDSIATPDCIITIADNLADQADSTVGTVISPRPTFWIWCWTGVDFTNVWSPCTYTTVFSLSIRFECVVFVRAGVDCWGIKEFDGIGLRVYA